jgi:GAF domain-containing protein
LRLELSAAQAELARARSNAERAADQSSEPERPASTPPVPSTPTPTWSHPAQRTLAAALASAADWRTGVKDTVKIVGSQGGWDAVVAWCPDERKPLLVCAAMWTSAPDKLGLFETGTWQDPQALLESEIGRAYAAGETLWLTGLEEAKDRHLTAAARHGMRSALIVPIRFGSETIGVLELLTRTRAGPDPELAAAVEAVTLQLAHLDRLLRLSAEPRWRLGRM